MILRLRDDCERPLAVAGTIGSIVPVDRHSIKLTIGAIALVVSHSRRAISSLCKLLHAVQVACNALGAAKIMSVDSERLDQCAFGVRDVDPVAVFDMRPADLAIPTVVIRVHAELNVGVLTESITCS